MPVVLLLFLLAIHLLSGNGLLYTLRAETGTMPRAIPAMILGVAIASFVPFLMQLMYIPLNVYSVAAGLTTAALLCNLRSIRTRKWNIGKLKLPSVHPGEWPFMFVFAIYFIVSAWRCFYLPVQARDMLSGPEAIASFAEREHTLINSFFTVNLESTNNQFKPLYITSLQLIYKLFGFPFGQIWLTVLFCCFSIFLYRLLRNNLHPVLAAALFLLLLTIPELYAYTYIILFDYSNMIFFFLGAYYLYAGLSGQTKGNVRLAIVFFTAATYCRLDTLLLTGMLAIAITAGMWRRKQKRTAVIKAAASMILFPAIVYVVCAMIYNNHYLPVNYQVGELVNNDLTDLQPLAVRWWDMNTQMVFGWNNTRFWSYSIYIFTILALADLLISRKVSREGRFWLLCMLVIYFGLPLLGFVFPLVDLDNTTKRGLFKLFPFMVLYLSQTTLLRRFSERIYAWERA